MGVSFSNNCGRELGLSFKTDTTTTKQTQVYFDIDTIELQGELQESAKAGEVGEKDGEL